MAEEKQEKPRPFDVKTVEHLLRLMTEHDLSEVDLKEGDQRIRLRKGAEFSPFHAPLPSPSVHLPAGPGPAAHAPATPPSPKFLEIKSELIGSFYARPAPDKPEFVKVGTRVTPETTVCLIIAMKVNNEIKASCTGIIREVCVRNEEGVDYGTVLFRVDPG